MTTEDYINIIDEAWGIFIDTHPTDEQKKLVDRLESAWYRLGKLEGREEA